MTERNDKRKEFLELIQGGMTVREYMTKFERLGIAAVDFESFESTL